MRRSPGSQHSCPAILIPLLTLLAPTLTASPGATATPATNPAVPRFETVGSVDAVFPLPSNKILIAGSFTHVNGIFHPFLARLNTDGTLDESFDASAILKAPAGSVAVQPDGKIFLGSRTDGPSGFALLRLIPDGQRDNSFPSDPSLSDAAIRIQPNGQIIVRYSGKFLKRFYINGSVDSTYNFSGDASGGGLLVQADNKLLVYGLQGGLNRYNVDGSKDNSFQAAITNPEKVLLQADGGILVRGISFTPSLHGALGRLKPDGSLDPAFNAALLGRPLALQSDGKILVSAPTNGRDAVFRLNSDGTLDASYSAQTEYFGQLSSIIHQPDGRALLSGTITSFNASRCTAIARLSSAGSMDSQFRPLVTQPAVVTALVGLADNKIIAGGRFITVDGQSSTGLARLEQDTTRDPLFQQHDVFAPNVRTLTIQPDGKIVATGSFTTNTYNSRSFIRFNPNGVIDEAFHLEPDVSGSFSWAAGQPDGALIYSGLIKKGSQDPTTLGRLFQDGTLDQTFKPVRVTSGPVSIQPNGAIITSRTLTVGDPSLLHFNILISRYAKDGTLDDQFQPAQLDTPVAPETFALASDGAILVGGYWRTVNGVDQPNLALLRTDGTFNANFKPAVNDGVHTITVQSDGKIVIGGYFTSVNGVPVPGVARLNANGTLDPNFHIETSGGAVLASTQLPNGQVVVGGAFGVATSIITPGPGETLSVGTSAPFATLVVASSIQDVKQVRFLVKGASDKEFVLVDKQTIPLATNGFIGPGHAENSGSPGFDSAVYGSDMFIPQQTGTYQLKVEVLDNTGNLVSSTITTVTAVDPNQVPPPQRFGIGDLATGTVLLANKSVIITADPKTVGSGLKKLELLVNGTVAQQINVGETAIADPFLMIPDPAGSYTFTFTPKAPGTFGLNIRATAGNGVTTTSNTIGVTAGASSRLLNISTRMFVDSGDNVLIGGTIVTGTGQKKVLIRAIGSSLGVAGVVGALPDPTLELRDGNGGLVASNDDWGDSPDKQAIIDTTISPSNAKESAILATLPASTAGINYTAVVKGANGTTGIGLVEVYDLDGDLSGTKLANISTRGKVLTGDNAMIGGFILGGVAGAAPAKVIVRGIGPSLPFPGALQDPILELHQGPTTIASNDDWKENEADVTATTIPPVQDHESAIVRTLQPLTGTTATATISTTAIVRGKNNGTGIALVEVYDLSK